MIDLAKRLREPDHKGIGLYSESSDEQLIRDAQHGSLEAFTALYERHLQAVYNRVRYMIPPEDVEDVTQEVFVSVLKSLGSFRGNAKFRTWLRTVTDRRIADFYQKRERQQNREEAMETDPVVSLNRQGDTLSSGLDEKILLQRALYRLPDHYQQVILLRFADGLKFKNVAREMDLSLEAAKSLYRRAIAALREELEQA